AGQAATGMAGKLLAAQAQEEECLGLLLERPAMWAEVDGIVADGDFAGTETRALFGTLADAVRANPSLDSQRFVEALPPVLQAVAERIRGQVAAEALAEGPGLVKYAAATAYRLKRTRLNEELAELDYLQRDAQQTSDAEALRALLRRKQHLLSQRRTLDAASGLHG